MPDFITLSCPSCGGKLQITKDIERFACGHCGHEHIINRSGGVVTITPLVRGIRQVQRGTDKTAAELALIRLREEDSSLVKEIQRLVYTLINNPNSYKKLLKKLGKISFFESTAEDTLRNKIYILSEGEIGMALVILEQGNRGRNRQIIDQLTTLKNLKSQLRLVRSRIDENKRIVDDLPNSSQPSITVDPSVLNEPKMMRSVDKEERAQENKVVEQAKARQEQSEFQTKKRVPLIDRMSMINKIQILAAVILLLLSCCGSLFFLVAFGNASSGTPGVYTPAQNTYGFLILFALFGVFASVIWLVIVFIWNWWHHR